MNHPASPSAGAFSSDEGDAPGVDSSSGAASVGQDVRPADYFAHAARWQWWAAVVLAIPSIPIIAAALLLVRCTSRGPALYRQTRVGLEGCHFQLVKIRTMRVDAEAATGAIWTTSLQDPRITLVGRVLRWTHIDELPQLWNVLRGEMVLVGPRPERPEFTGMLAQSLPGYLSRLTVMPGVTGLAQINLPADSDLESVRKKLSLDLQYIQEGTLQLDLRIIFCTAARLFGVRSDRLRKLFHVARRANSAPQAGSNGDESAARLQKDLPSEQNVYTYDDGKAFARSRANNLANDSAPRIVELTSPSAAQRAACR